jgi:hypothetical protein
MSEREQREEQKAAASVKDPAPVSSSSESTALGRVQSLQRTAGNRATAQMLQPSLSKREQSWHNIYLAVDAKRYGEAAAMLNQLGDADLLVFLRQLQPSSLRLIRQAAPETLGERAQRVIRAIDRLAALENEAERKRQIEEAYGIAVLMQNWEQVAIQLNNYSDQEIVRKLERLGTAAIRAVAAAAPRGTFRVARIALAMLPDSSRPANAPGVRASGAAGGSTTTTILAAGAMVPLGDLKVGPTGTGGGPFQAPGLNTEPIETPGFGKGSFRNPFIEPPRPGQAPARLPSATVETPAVDPLPPGITAEIRLGSAMRRLLVVGTEVIGAIALPLELGAMGISDTNMEEATRRAQVGIVEDMRKIVLDVNQRLGEAIRRLDFHLIRQKAPGLYNAAVQRTDTDLLLAIRLLKLAYGITVEKLVADAIRSNPYLSQYLDYVAGPNRADFYGKKGTMLGGFLFDVTTKADVKRHTDPNLRPRYGENLITVPYHPPWNEDGW